jgi:hypothetical protein
MPYFPKSKVNISETSGNEFIIKSTRESYKGKYVELSNGLYYAGNNPQKLGEEIIRPDSPPSNFNNDSNFRKHIILNEKTYNLLKNFKNIPSEKPKPTEKDYKKGYYNRYFVKRINGEEYKEVSSDTFKSIFNKKKEYDHNLYNIGALKWALTGNSILINKNSVLELEKTFLGVSSLFSRFDEFYKRIESPQSNDRWNIKGRFYPNPDGQVVSSKLPPAYRFSETQLGATSNKDGTINLPKKLGSCKYCSFYKEEPNNSKENYPWCTKWDAEIRDNYKCNAFLMAKKYQKQLTETKKFDKSSELKSDEMVTRREIISPTVSRGGGTSRPSRGETSGVSSGGRGGY